MRAGANRCWPQGLHAQRGEALRTGFGGMNWQLKHHFVHPVMLNYWKFDCLGWQMDLGSARAKLQKAQVKGFCFPWKSETYVTQPANSLLMRSHLKPEKMMVKHLA